MSEDGGGLGYQAGRCLPSILGVRRWESEARELTSNSDVGSSSSRTYPSVIEKRQSTASGPTVPGVIQLGPLPSPAPSIDSFRKPDFRAELEG